MADHLVEDRSAQCARQSPRRGRPPRSRRAAAGSPIRTSFASAARRGRSGEPGSPSRPSRPRRSAAPSRAARHRRRPARARSSSAEQAGDAGRVEPLGAKHVGRPPGRRCDPERDPGPRPASAAATVAKVLPVPASPITTDEPLAARRVSGATIARWSAFRVGWAARTRATRPRPTTPWPSVPRSHRPRGGERVALKLPDPLGGEARDPSALSAIRDHRVGGEEGIGDLPRPRRPGRRRGSWSATAWITSRRSKWEARAVTARSRLLDASTPWAPRPGRSRPKVRRDRLAVEADLLALSSRQRSRRLSAVRSRSLALRVSRVATWRARAEAPGRRRPRGSRRGGWRTRAGARDRRSPRSRRCRCSTSCQRTPRLLGQLVAEVRLVDVAGGLRVLIDRRVVEPGPAAVGPMGRVGDRTWVWSWGSPAREERWTKAAARKPLPWTNSRPPCTAAGPAGLALHVVERGLDGARWACGDLGRGPLAAERPESGRRTSAPRR